MHTAAEVAAKFVTEAASTVDKTVADVATTVKKGCPGHGHWSRGQGCVHGVEVEVVTEALSTTGKVAAKDVSLTDEVVAAATPHPRRMRFLTVFSEPGLTKNES